MIFANDNDPTNCRIQSRPRRPDERELSARERDAIIEKLEDEHDILCLGRPPAWRIAAALQKAARTLEVFA